MNHLNLHILPIMALVLTLTGNVLAAPDQVKTTSQKTIQTRQVNNGQVILEDIPNIPESIVGALNRYQNVGSARAWGWTKDSKSMHEDPSGCRIAS